MTLAKFYGNLWEMFTPHTRIRLQRIKRYTEHGKIRTRINRLWESFTYGIITNAQFEKGLQNVVC